MPDAVLWSEAYVAIQKVCVAALLVAAHKGLEIVIGWVNSGTSFPLGTRVLETYFFVAFAVIEARLVLDAVLLFLFAPLPRRSGNNVERAENDSTSRLLYNRYITVLIDIAGVTTWALVVFRGHTTDEIAASTLVVMLTILVVGEILTRGLQTAVRLINARISKNATVQSDESSRATSSFSLSVRIAGWSIAVAIAVFVVVTAYGAAFFLSVPVLRINGMNWATGATLFAGFCLVGFGIFLLVFAATIAITGLLFSFVSWSVILQRIYRKTALTFEVISRIQGFVSHDHASDSGKRKKLRIAASH